MTVCSAWSTFRYGNEQGGIKELINTYRVVLVHRDRYLVRNEGKELYCTLTGSLRYREAFPVVGDEVEITENPYGDSLIR
jgi:putative ribosome biogenesis GTPase RsgA